MNKKKSIKNKNEFLNYMLDLLEPMGELSYKPLFGGYAICKHDVAFALVFDGTVYFKTDATNRKDYESYNSNPCWILSKLFYLGRPLRTIRQVIV